MFEQFLNVSNLTKHSSSVKNIGGVPSKLCACARAHRLQRLRTRINMLRTDILLLTIKLQFSKSDNEFFRQRNRTIFGEDLFVCLHLISDTKTTLFFGLHLISDTKTALNFGHNSLGEFPQEVRAHQNVCAQ